VSNPFVICFAGVSGCGKSSIAHELSIELAIPRFERDKIRQEVKDDFFSEGFSAIGRSRRI
jgi:2-phosphoglycerate kinase